MNDYIFDNLEPVHMPSLDLTRSFELAKSVQAHMDESQRHMEQISRSAYEERRRTQEAIERTAENTAQTNIQLQKIIENQNAYIDLLRGQLETSQKQLDILKNLFASTEDGVTVEKEIMKIIQANIDEKHPLWEYVKDKGGDVAVAGVLQWGPVIWTALKTYLATQGILIP